MKQNYFKSLLIAMLVLFGGGGVFATEEIETIVFSEQGYQNQQTITTVSVSDITITFNKGTNSNAPKYYTSGTAIRAYGGNYFTITADGKTIKKIEIGFGSSDGTNAITTDVSTYSNGTWTGEAKSVTFTIGGTSGNRRIASIKVTYSTAPDTRIPVTLTFSKDEFTTPTESGVIEGAPTLTVDPEEATSEVTFSSSKESVAIVDADGVVTAVSPGKTTITASIRNNINYLDASASYELTVMASSNLNYNPTSVTVTYDKKDNFTAPELNYTDGYNGTITYTSSNPSVATVAADGTVSILAVGETTIIASGAATDYLKASEASFTLTVNDIQGSATGGGNGESIFKETFDQTDGTGGSAEGPSYSAYWSGSAGQSTIVADEEGWSLSTSNGGAYKCIKLGAGKSKGYAMTRYIDVEIGKTYTLTFKAAPWSNESAKMIVTVTEGCTIDGISEDDMTPYYWNNYTATITPNTVSQIRIKFEASQNRFFLDEINVVAPSADNTVQVTIPSSGWGTYCCQWPLDFTAASAPEGLKAYAVSSTSTSNATLTEITEKIIGGTGIIINGTPGTTYTINVADQGAAYSGTNLLTGTLAPTYVEEGQYFLKSGKFVYSSAGTLPANKAYLKSANAPEAAANLGFVVEESTGISEVLNNISLDDDKWYDLSGRVVSPTSKGIYIHNGKKYIIK